MCRLAAVSRTGYYRHWRASKPQEADTELRHRLQQLALSHRHYGYRRLGALLRREEWTVNHKRVLRLLQADNLLCLRRKAFVPATTESRHSWHVWPNLIRGIQTTGLNQLWVADITYLHLREEFVFLAVVLDAHSRRAVGWAIDRNLGSSLTLQALRMALAKRKPEPGMIHHSDRGVQYACDEYVEMLKQYGIQISMSRVGNPYDNAKAESFIKTLKKEEVDGRCYRNFGHLRNCVTEFLGNVYNLRRLHSALGYLSPIEFEEQLTAPRISIELCGGKGINPPSPTPPTPIQLSKDSVPIFSVSG